MEVRLTLQELAENGSHGFPRVSCYGQYDSQAGNGRKWQEMAEKSSPRLFGRKWTSRAICAMVIEVARQASVSIDIGQNTLKISLPQK